VRRRLSERIPTQPSELLNVRGAFCIARRRISRVPHLHFANPALLLIREINSCESAPSAPANPIRKTSNPSIPLLIRICETFLLLDGYSVPRLCYTVQIRGAIVTLPAAKEAVTRINRSQRPSDVPVVAYSACCIAPNPSELVMTPWRSTQPTDTCSVGCLPYSGCDILKASINSKRRSNLSQFVTPGALSLQYWVRISVRSYGCSNFLIVQTLTKPRGGNYGKARPDLLDQT